ncbi:MAG: GNAT family N-acetyltransferase [Nitrosarchaeum sp.]
MLIREVLLDDSNFLYDLYLKRPLRDILTQIKYSEQILFIKNYLEKSDKHPFQSWFIIEIDGKKVGSLTLHKKNNEIGYWLLPEFQNKGFGTKAIKQFIEINKKSYYTIRTHIDNKRSQHIAEKLNFKLSQYEFRLEL